MRKDGIGRGLVWPALTQNKRHDAGEGSQRQRFAASHSDVVVGLAPSIVLGDRMPLNSTGSVV